MKNKSTTELLKELENFSSFEEYQNANKDFMINKSLSEYLCSLLKERNLSRAEVIKKSELGEFYTYQLFAGTKSSPTRDKIISLSIGMDLTVSEANSLLKLAGHLPLYPRTKRDSIIIIGINNGKGVININEMLYDEGEKTLN